MFAFPNRWIGEQGKEFHKQLDKYGEQLSNNLKENKKIEEKQNKEEESEKKVIYHLCQDIKIQNEGDIQREKKY